MISDDGVYVLRSLIYDIGTYTFSLFSRLIPKNRYKILFFSTPDFSDNSKYVYQKIVEMDTDKKYRLIWCVHDSIDVDHVIRRSLMYYYHILTAKYIVSTHGTPKWKSSSQVGIELWHGFPLKNGGYYKDFLSCDPLIGHTIKRRLRRFSNTVDFLVVSSHFGRFMFSSLLLVNPKKIILLGQPRCDALYRDIKVGRNILSRLLGCNLISNKKVIFYLPTFREYNHNISRKMMEDILTNNEFHRFLEDEDVMFVCKPHPNDKEVFCSYNSKNVRVLLNEDLKREEVTLYDLLNAVDILITDYSSVYFDYLLLNRPIVFYVPDIEEYRTKRGFILDPFEDWTPGDKVNNINELIQSLNIGLRNPKRWECERLRLKRILHQYDDGNSSERVYNFILRDVESK